MNGNDAKAVIKILAKPPLGNFFLKILVGRRNDAHIHVAFFLAANRPYFAFLQYAIKLHLHGQAHVADFVHEQRAAVRGLKQSVAVIVCPGERALHVAEKFRLQQRLRKSAAIDGDEGACARALFS